VPFVGTLIGPHGFSVSGFDISCFPFQGLNARLFINAQNNGLHGRFQVQPHYVGCFGSKIFIRADIASFLYFLGDKNKWGAFFSISSLLGGVALLGIETFNGEFSFFEKTVFNSSNNPGGTEEFAYSHPALDSVGSITGFKEGTADKEYDTLQFIKIAMDIKNRSDIAGLLVIGEVDKRELKDLIKNQFGSNLSLARARAEYIKTRLSKIVLHQNIPMITFGRGAYHTNLNDQSSDQDKDRQVVVYAITNNIRKLNTPC
jgi:hypothetical protein